MKQSRFVFLFPLMVALSLGLFLGCGSGGGSGEAPTKPVYVPEVDPGSVAATCCGVKYGTVIEGTSPAGGQYYVLALMDKDTIVSYGEAVFVPEGTFSGVTLEATVNYLDGIPSGNYQKSVLSFASLEQVGHIKSRTSALASDLVEVLSYEDSVCTVCCTNEANGGLRRYYAGVIKDVGNAVRVSAKIATKYGWLCGQGTPTEDTVQTHSGAWVGMQGNIPPATATDFIQFGYMRMRSTAPQTTYMTIVFFEMSPVNAQMNYMFIYDLPDVPEPVLGTAYYYSVELDTSSATITYAFDGYGTPFSATAWQDHATLSYVRWTGEIDARESDMPGTENDPCKFTDCRYRLSDEASPMSADFSLTDYIGVTPQKGNRPDEWATEFVLGGDELSIWDVNPHGLE